MLLCVRRICSDFSCNAFFPFSIPRAAVLDLIRLTLGGRYGRVGNGRMAFVLLCLFQTVYCCGDILLRPVCWISALVSHLIKLHSTGTAGAYFTFSSIQRFGIEYCKRKREFCLEKTPDAVLFELMLT